MSDLRVAPINRTCTDRREHGRAQGMAEGNCSLRIESGPHRVSRVSALGPLGAPLVGVLVLLDGLGENQRACIVSDAT